MKVSQSTLGAADKCMLSAQYTLDHPVGFRHTSGASRATGTGYHSGMAGLYTARMLGQDELTVSAVIDLAVASYDLEKVVDSYSNTPVEVFKYDDKVPDDATAHSLMKVMIETYYEHHRWPQDWRVLGVETPFKVPVETQFDFELQASAGGIDLVLQDPIGYVLAVDHKTANKAWDQGKHKPRKNNQSPYYVHFGLRTMWPDAVGYRMVFDVIQYPNKSGECKFERRISDPDAKDEAAIKKKMMDFAFMYDLVHVKAGMDLPANPASTLCNPKWCDFWDVCPYGATLDR